MSPPHDKPGCTQPALGEQATRALGRAPSAAVRRHVDACPACSLERRAFASLGQHGAAPNPALAEMIKAAWRVRSGRSPSGDG